MKTTIKLDVETRTRLNKLKYSIGAKSLDETINHSIDLLEKIRGSEE